MNFDGLSINLRANLLWIPIIVYFKLPYSLKKEPFKNTLDTEECEGFHIARFSTLCKDAKKYTHTNIIINSICEWKWSFIDNKIVGFFPRACSFKDTYSKRYASLCNRLVHSGKILPNYASTILEPIQTIGETQFGKPYFPLFLTNQKEWKIVIGWNFIKFNDNNKLKKYFLIYIMISSSHGSEFSWY